MAQMQRIPGTMAAYAMLAMTAVVIGVTLVAAAWLIAARLS